MTALLGLNAYQSEALIACLAASLVWAGLLLFGAMHLERTGAARGDRLWIGALLLAVLPSLIAPSLAAFGVSLRPVTETAAAAPALAPMAIEAKVRAVDTAASVAAAPTLTLDQALNGLALIYIYGAALALFIWGTRQFGFLIAAALATPDHNTALTRAVDDWAFEFGVKPPALRRSRHVSSVCLYGAVAPVVLVPHDIDARVAEKDIALMCAHEIAHLKRGDTRLFTATALARVLFWFNPLVTRIAARVELAAEEGADRLVIGAGVDRRAYAACFVKGLRYAALKQTLLPAMAPSFTPADRHGRRRRLDAILSGSGEAKSPVAARLLLAVAAAGAVMLAVGQAAFAVDPEVVAEKKRRTAPPAPTEATPDLATPLDGDVTLGFGKIYKSLEDNTTLVNHKGIDIKAPMGEPVKASGDGIVVEATANLPGKESYGTTVVIDHGHGLLSRYAHLGSYSVARGQKVKKGDIIGAVGETGRVTGPHLHFEVLRQGEPVDPQIAMAPEAPEPPEAPDWIVQAPPAAPLAPLDPEDAQTQFIFAGEDGFAFANGDSLTDRMATDLEQRLLGNLTLGENSAYDLSFTVDGKTRRFTSGEPMTPEKRAELKAAIAEMRAHQKQARREIERASRELEANRSIAFQWRAESDARDHAEAAREAAEDHRLAMEEARRESFEAEREALEAEREALEDARADIEDAVEDGLSEALDDLDAEESSLAEDTDLSGDERRIIREALELARRDIERARREHAREIDRARQDLDRHRAEIEQKMSALRAREAEEN
ncbi:MAG: peptidoglycan DD-metalloendopeptidase family protein [Parvularculaceae bacterium]